MPDIKHRCSICKNYPGFNKICKVRERIVNPNEHPCRTDYKPYSESEFNDIKKERISEWRRYNRKDRIYRSLYNPI